ncbi:hypothetical protein GCM10023205_70640 [Yinghuangia aomiensis]|uniref:Uncharacterized protein n=1 Tax=Yinghuangia aomiensis TaxID=676205 RepID=A0ABP9I7B5_9ACTN
MGLGEGYVMAGGHLAHWVSGLLRRGALGGPKGYGQSRKFVVEVFRCPSCGHLELFANQPM